MVSESLEQNANTSLEKILRTLLTDKTTDI